MERIEKLEIEIRKYRRLRMIFRTLEAVSIAALIIVFVYSASNSLLDIIDCLAAALIVPESSLAVLRYVIKMSIRDEKLICERELEFYSAMRTECEEIRNDFISKGSENFISDEAKQLVWKEEIGIGWLSNKLKEFETRCKEAEKIIKDLAFMKRLVIF